MPHYAAAVEAGDWISLAGVVIAAVVAVVSAVWAVRSARAAGRAEEQAAQDRAVAEQQAERATHAAERAAVAEAASARAAERAAAALEEQNRRAEERDEQEEGVPWSIAFRRGSTYDLWNDTNTPKYAVRVFGEGVLREKAVQRVDGRSSVEFMGLDASGVSNEVQVTWHRREDQSDEPRAWTGSKPAKS